jgi:hypothetical protein
MLSLKVAASVKTREEISIAPSFAKMHVSVKQARGKVSLETTMTLAA